MCLTGRLLLVVALFALTGWCGEGETMMAPHGGEIGVGGGRPMFAQRQRTVVVGVVGGQVRLECDVLHLSDKAVSWVRSRDLQILTHAGSVFTADSRVSCDTEELREASMYAHALITRNTLQVEKLRASDAGRYECQVNTEPKMSLFFNLTVLSTLMPTVTVSALTAEVHGEAGGTATLACEARYTPSYPTSASSLDIHWYKNELLIDLQSTRGGVSLEAERWPQGAVSRLTLAHLQEADAGRYICTVEHAADYLVLTVDVHGTGYQMEAMQRDQSQGLSPGSRAPISASHGPPLSAAATATASLLMWFLSHS